MLREVFSGKCPSCGGSSEWEEPLCSKCVSKIVKSFPPCHRCGYPIRSEGGYCYACFGEKRFAGGRVYSCFKYTGVIRDLILSIKFNYNIRSGLTFNKILSIPENFNPEIYDIITPVPSHFIRRFRRFQHPAEIAANYISSISTKPVVNVLKRSKLTGFQYKLGARERRNNVHGAFEVRSDINMLNILLVDDIFTTGSTLNECAQLLRATGASTVDCFVLAVD